MRLLEAAAKTGGEGGSSERQSHVEPLGAAPAVVEFIAAKSRRVLLAAVFLFCSTAGLGLFAFWPIRIRENFEEYLQCDGPQHGRLKAYRTLRKAWKDNPFKGLVPSAPLRSLEDVPDGPAGLAEENAEGYSARSLTGVPERSTIKFFIKLIYATRDGSNIFTEEHLSNIQDMERRLIQQCPSYGDFCLSDYSDGCVEPISVINYFYASQNPKTGDIVADGKGTHILPIQAMLASLGAENAYFVDRYFGVSKDQLETTLQGNITRSVFRFALPLKGYDSAEDRFEEQEHKFRRFVAEELYPYLSRASAEGVQVYFYGDVITAYEVEHTVWHDAAFSLGSLFFIFIYLVVHLRSAYLAAAALGCIALSFPLAYTLYCCIYGHGRMIAINFLSLFVVLGVGADDVFVLNDVWILSREHGLEDAVLGRRLWSMYKKAGAAIFATSATTAVSFFANLASSIGPLRQFGFFMGTCITANWVVVAAVYPIVLVDYERRRRSPKVALANKAKSSGGLHDFEMQEQLVVASVFEEGEQRGVENAAATLNDKVAFGSGGAVGRSPARRKAVACAACAAGLAFPAAAVVGALHSLRPSKGVPQFFPKESNLGALQDLQKRFGNETSVRSVDLRLCEGRLMSAADCARLHAAATPVAPPAPSPLRLPASLPQAAAPATIHLPPPTAASQSRPVVVTDGGTRVKAPTTPSFPSSSPALVAPQEVARSFDYQVEVKGYSAADIEMLKLLWEESLLKELDLRPEDVTVDINDVEAVSARMLGVAAAARALSAAGSVPEAAVVLHFHHLSARQEAKVRQYLQSHKDMLQGFGVSSQGDVKSSGGMRPSHVATSARPGGPWSSAPDGLFAGTSVRTTTDDPFLDLFGPLPTPVPTVAEVEPLPFFSTTTAAVTTTAAPTIGTSLRPRGPSSTTTANAAVPQQTTRQQQHDHRSQSTSSPQAPPPAPQQTAASRRRAVRRRGSRPPSTTPQRTTAAAAVTTTARPRPAPAATSPAVAPSTSPRPRPPPPRSSSFPQRWPRTPPPPRPQPRATSTSPPRPLAPAAVRSPPALRPTPPPMPVPTQRPTPVPTPMPTPRPPAASLSHFLDGWTKGFGQSEQTPQPTLQATPRPQPRQRPPPAPTAAPLQVPVPHPVFQKRGMAYDRTALVSVLWGLRDGDASKLPALRTEGEDLFDCSGAKAQQALVQFCEEVEKAEELKSFKTTCWPRDFAEFLRMKRKPFPTREFHAELRIFMATHSRWIGDYAGFDDKGRGPTWLSVDFHVEFDSHSSGRDTKPYMEAWEEFADKFEGKAPEALGRPLPTSEIFERAEAELRVINSALSSWLVSVACALVAVVAFTRNLSLSAMATFAIFATAASSLYAITSIFQWDFGLMEAVSLIIFCGFSVDYPLHIVQAHIQEHGSKGTGAQQALREVGWAVISGCVTTCGAASFLMLCEIRIFQRFGQVLIVNMIFSVIFALIWIPSVLELYDPLQRRQGVHGGQIGSAASASSLQTVQSVHGGGGAAHDDDIHEGFVALMTPR
eukprot:TRINITY_DN80717_c0_g1_i1.p1 TRINITY_DN80717_c0_g1~~TRINITY_DN80717_c0_g1_i1.p1  ORF type:complete len:1522 (-),score=374.32 TRINITY_DN80717_c0_g1_i1:72-4637(-)